MGWESFEECLKTTFQFFYEQHGVGVVGVSYSLPTLSKSVYVYDNLIFIQKFQFFI